MTGTSSNTDKGAAQQEIKKPVNRENLRFALKVFQYILPYKGTFILGMVFLILSTLTALSFPYLAGELVDAATSTSRLLPDSVHLIALVMFGILVAQSVFSFFRLYLFALVSEKSMADIRRSLYNKLVVLPLSFFEKRRIGELTSRITNDVAQLQDMISMVLAEFFRQIATLIIGLCVLFVLSTKLTLIMLATIPVLIIAALVFGRFIRKLSKKRQDSLADSNVVVEESLQNIHTVKAFTNESFESKRYGSLLDQVIRHAVRLATYRGLFSAFIIFGLFGGIVLVLWLGAMLVESGDMLIGELTTFIFFTIFIGGSIGGMGDLYTRIQRSLGASERILDILEEEEEVAIATASGQRKLSLEGAIRFRNVRFNYPTRRDINVLHDFNLSIGKGEKIALAGQSGAGKSTIAHLLMGFYRLQEGSIMMDSHPIDELDPTELRKNIAIVPQEVLLFGGTIGENIAYGKPGASQDEIIEAAKKANAWEFIRQFPEGLDTIVGERGIKLSGGQRQRIAIARAILKDPAILILDEATSSLDAQSEKLVQDALKKLMANRTTLIIAHRLSTIRHVDRIYVLEKGKILETGTFDELAAKEDGLFNQLLKLQYEDDEVLY